MNTYVRHVKVDDLDVIFEPIIKHSHLGPKEKARLDVQGHSVGIVSLRLRTFAKARIEQGLYGPNPLHCVTCGLRATFFAVENTAQAPKGTKPHLNLYGLAADGEEVLFTHDHARGLGGTDHISNTQIMCSPCNATKAIGEQAEANRLAGIAAAKKGKLKRDKAFRCAKTPEARALAARKAKWPA